LKTSECNGIYPFAKGQKGAILHNILNPISRGVVATESLRLSVFDAFKKLNMTKYFYSKKRYCAIFHNIPRSMVIRDNNKQNSGKLKDAASLLLKGGTLINDPCPSCTGVQVRFQNENICINGCNPQDLIGKATRTESGVTNDEVKKNRNTNKSLPKSIIQEKIILLIQQIRDENDISAQKIKADLIESYLRILEKTATLEDPRYQG
jgi:UPF0148 protein